MFKYWITMVIGSLPFLSFAQSGVGIGIENPNPNAVLELVAPDNNQGFLVPRLTTAQRTSNPFLSNLNAEDNGLLVYDIDLNRFFFWINTNWQPVSPQNSLTAGTGISITGNVITNTGDTDTENEIQDLELDGATLRITNNASATDIDLSPFVGTNTDEQDLGFNGSEITITNGSNVDVSGWDLDASDDFDGNYNNLSNRPSLFSGNFSDLTGVPADLADGDNVDDADANPSNEIQDLELDGSTLRITNNVSATDIDLSPFSGTNTDEQDLGFNGSEITITNGDNVDVSAWDLDASDDFDGNYDNLSNRPSLFSGNFSDLTGVPADLADGDNVNDADANPSNEIQDLELDGSTLRITNNAGATDIDLSPFSGTNTDEQDLGFNGSEITITNGDNVDVSGWDLDTSDDFDGAFSSLSGVPAGLTDGDDVNDADSNPSNEIQDLELDGSTLRITNNASATDIDLSPFAGTNTDEQDLGFNGSEITITNGDNVDVSTWDLNAADDFDGNYNSLANRPTLFSGNFSDLAGIPSGLVDGDDVNDADADADNETITNLNLDGTNLEITEAGNTSSIDLAGLQDGTGTDNQTLSLNPDPQQLVISGGNALDITGWDLDTSDDFFLPATASFNTGDNILDLTNNGGGITAVFDRNNNAVSNPALRSFSSGLGPAAEFDQARDGDGDIIVAFRDQGNLVASVNDLGQFVGDGSQLTNLPATLPNQSGNSGRFLTTDGSAASWANVPSSQWSGTNSISFTGEDAAVNAGSSSNAGFSVNRTGTSPNNVGLSINNLVTSPINSPSDKIGLQITSTGAFGTEGGTNIGLDVNVSGGNAQNIAAQFDGGNVVVSNGELRVEETVRISNNTATNFPLFFIDGNFSGDAAMRFSSSNTFTMGVDGSDNIFKISDWTSLGTNDRLSINSTGQVGIGTSLLSTNIKMEIENTERFSLWLDNNYSGGLDNYAVFVPDMTGSGNKYAFYQSGTTDENYFAGNVGIGTTTPSARLDVEASTVGYVAEITNLSTLGTPFSPDILRLNYTSTSPGGSSWAVGVFTGSTTLEGGIRMNGGTVGIFQASDRRRKEMIENTNINGLEIINSITIRDYNFIGKSERKTGFIAQELQDAYKPAVFGDPDGDVDSDPMTVSYSELIPVTIKAIQEQQDIIESLQKELESMKQKLATSEALESSLQSQLEKQSAEIEAIKKAIGLNVNAKVANHE